MAGRKPDVTDEEILDVLLESSEPVLTTREVSEKLPIKLNAAQIRLKNLYEENQIKGKKAGNAWVWWLGEQKDCL